MTFEPLVTTATTARPEEAHAGARARVSVGEPEEWVRLREVEGDCAQNPGGNACYILIEQQRHGTRQARYERSVRRLETTQAVQAITQWQLAFHPAGERVCLHAFSVRRGGRSLEFAESGRVRLLSGEDHREHSIVEGRMVLALLVDDVRVGDVVDISYTVHGTAPLLQGHVWFMLPLPEELPVNLWAVSLRFPAALPMRWRSNVRGLEPSIRDDGEETEWEWIARDFRAEPAEPQTAPWLRDAPYLQASSWPDWTEVAKQVGVHWGDEFGSARLNKEVEDLFASAPGTAERVERAIETVQDDIRLADVRWNAAIQAPTSPGEVLRRCFGDARDKAHLLVHLLRSLGVAARPVLVASRYRGGIAELLPAPDLLDHALAEYEWLGKRRLVDLGATSQGGGASSRTVPAYGLGVPISQHTAGLEELPPGTTRSDRLELRETFMLDTAGRTSALRVLATACGAEADHLRGRMALEGAGEFARRQEQSYREIFPRAERIGLLEWRDDRTRNEFAVAEAYELTQALSPAATGGGFIFEYRSHLVQRLLACPEGGLRKHAFALPHPCHVEHWIELESPDLPRGQNRVVKVRDTAFQYDCESTELPGRWGITFALRTQVPHVPAVHFENFRTKIRELWPSTHVAVTLPSGSRVPWRKRTPTELLPPARSVAPAVPASPDPLPSVPALLLTSLEGSAAYPRPPAAQLPERVLAPSVAAAPPPLPASTDETPPDSPKAGRRRSRRKKKVSNAMFQLGWIVLTGASALLLWIVLLLRRG